MTDEQIIELTKQVTGWTTHFDTPQEPHGHFYAEHRHQASVESILHLSRALLSSSKPVVAPGLDVSDLFVDRAAVLRVFDFYKKHAIGSLAAPSCLACGRSTQGLEVAIKHMELLDIVICVECHSPAAPAQSGEPVAWCTKEFVISRLHEAAKEPPSQRSVGNADRPLGDIWRTILLSDLQEVLAHIAAPQPAQTDEK